MPDDGMCAWKYVAQCYMTLRFCVRGCISFVCDLEKHNGMYQNKIVRGSQTCSINKHMNLKQTLNLERSH